MFLFKFYVDLSIQVIFFFFLMSRLVFFFMICEKVYTAQINPSRGFIFKDKW